MSTIAVESFSSNILKSIITIAILHRTTAYMGHHSEPWTMPVPNLVIVSTKIILAALTWIGVHRPFRTPKMTAACLLFQDQHMAIGINYGR